jgi:hypothetical protein
MRLWWLFLLVAALTVVFSCELAHARPPSSSAPSAPSASSREIVRSADRAIEIGEYGVALERLEVLFLATADPALLPRIAACHRALGRPSEAARALRLHAMLTR